MYFISYFVGIVLIHTQLSYARLNHIQIGANLTDFMQLQRQRRSLIFNGNGLVKHVILLVAAFAVTNLQKRVSTTVGSTLPKRSGFISGQGMSLQQHSPYIDAGAIASINLGDPVDWRSIVSINNIQGGHYPLPSEPLYPWDKWEDTFARSLKNLLPGSTYETDDSRKFAYAAIEALMQLQHGNGHTCLLRSICKNAQVDDHVGMFSEIMDVVLSPGREDIDVAYMEAFQAGKSGADCLRLYAECRVSSNFLDQYLDYV